MGIGLTYFLTYYLIQCIIRTFNTILFSIILFYYYTYVHHHCILYHNHRCFFSSEAWEVVFDNYTVTEVVKRSDVVLCPSELFEDMLPKIRFLTCSLEGIDKVRTMVIMIVALLMMVLMVHCGFASFPVYAYLLTSTSDVKLSSHL